MIWASLGAEEIGAQLHFIDVGEGQCTLIDMGETEILVDGGADGRPVREYLDFTGVIDGPIELVVITHADADAYAGFSAIFLKKTALGMPGLAAIDPAQEWERIPVLEVWEPGDFEPAQPTQAGQPVRLYGPLYTELIAAIRAEAGTALKRPLAQFHPPALATGKVEWFRLPTVANAEFAILSSGAKVEEHRQLSERRNDASLVFLMKIAGRTIYFAGGVYGVDRRGEMAGIEARLVNEHSSSLKADILIGPRNGSATASSPFYVRCIDPKMVLFGYSKTLRHPRPEVVKRYEEAGVQVLRTDLHPQGGRDHVIVEWRDGEEMKVNYGVGYGFGDSKKAEWAGRSADGKIITRRDIDRWLRSVETYLTNPRTTDPRDRYRGADLCRLDLKGALLPKVDFSQSDLRQATLIDADLTGALLTGTDLRASNLSKAVLVEAKMKDTDLRGSVLEGVNLRGADLTKAQAQGVNFAGAIFENTILQTVDFTGADLSGSRLVDCTLKGTALAGANLKGVIFEPLDFAIKNPRDLRGSPDLGFLHFEKSPHALIELRKDVWDAGFEDAGRDLTYTIEKGRTDRMDPWERLFRRVLFEWPVGYGRNPARPLVVVLVLAVLLAVPYWTAIRWRPGRGGIFRIPGGSPAGIPGELKKAQRINERGLKACLSALYFSFVSAFHIGWRDLNIGSWLLSFQPREYLLKANGWVRVMAGVQSLVSVYLFALTVLSYFGRLFE